MSSTMAPLAEGETGREIVLLRPMSITGDDGGVYTYPAGRISDVPGWVADHWWTKNFISPDGSELAPVANAPDTTAATGPNSAAILIAQREMAQRESATLRSELSRITGLWTESVRELRETQVKLAEAQRGAPATSSASQTPAEPAQAPAPDHGRAGLEGRVAILEAENAQLRDRVAELQSGTTQTAASGISEADALRAAEAASTPPGQQSEPSRSETSGSVPETPSQDPPEQEEKKEERPLEIKKLSSRHFRIVRGDEVVEDDLTTKQQAEARLRELQAPSSGDAPEA